MRVVFDAEFDSLTPTKLWVLVAREIERDREWVFRYDYDKDWKNLRRFAGRVTRWYGANNISFDGPALNKLGILEDFPCCFPEAVDLQVVSRLINYNRPGGHSVRAYGEQIGIKKPEIEVFDDPSLIDEYETRCIEDTRIQLEMYRELERYIDDPSFQKALKVEHETVSICEAISERGFAFDKPKAEHLLGKIEKEMQVLVDTMHKTIPPIVVKKPERVLRKKADGSPFSRVCDLFPDGVPSYTDGTEFHPIEFEHFNPGSTKQRIDVLNRAGWKPVAKTKGHMLALRRGQHDKLERYSIYGWKVNEENLGTLPRDAPEGARALAEWLTLEGRRGDLVEWLDAYNPTTQALHPTIFHIGSWTHRKSHSRPNCANIFGPFHEGNCKDREHPTPVEGVKLRYNNQLRSTWVAREGHLLVGTDAEGIQLRILAHAMQDEEYAEAVASGRKEDETDVHNVNRRALGLSHISRDDAKTFIYGWVLGASHPKVAEILKCNLVQARDAERTFLTRLPKLRNLKQDKVPFFAKRGYFDGVDGRKVICRDSHLVLAGILQNGESCVMKHANVLWRKWADEEELPYFQVNDVHDEWQNEVPIISRLQFDEEGRPWTAESRRIGELQRKSIEHVGRELGILTPLAGKTITGRNWYETH